MKKASLAFSSIFLVAIIMFSCNPAHAIFKVQQTITGAKPGCNVIDRSNAVIFEWFNKNIYISTNEGESWIKNVSADLAGVSPESIYFTSPTTGYVLGINSANTLEVYKTIDGGTTFPSPKSGFTGMTGSCSIHFNRFNPDMGVICSPNSGNIYVTTDGGSTWTSTHVVDAVQSLDATCILSATFSGSSTIFVCGTGEGAFMGGIPFGPVIFKSADRGTSWSNVVALPYPGYNASSVSAADSSNIYALISYKLGVDANNLLMASTDGGDSWTGLDYLPKYSTLLTNLAFSSKNVGWVAGVTADPYILGLRPSIFRTLNAGRNWEEIRLPSQVAVIQGSTGEVYSLSCDTVSGIMYCVARPYGSLIDKDVFVSNVSPSIASVSETTIEAGSSEVLTITGLNFETKNMSLIFQRAAAASVEIHADDVLVGPTTVSSTTSLTVEVTVASNAASGTRTLTVRNPDLTFATAEIFVKGAIPSSSVEISSVNPGIFVPGNVNYVQLIGKGFDLNSKLTSGSPDITLEGFNVIKATYANVRIYVSSETTASSATLTLTNPDGASSAKTILISKLSDTPVNMTQINRNPDVAPITLYFNGLPSHGTGHLVMSSGLGGTSIPLDFAAIAANKNKQDITKANFSNGVPNGIYSSYLYSSDGKKLGKIKIVIFR